MQSSDERGGEGKGDDGGAAAPSHKPPTPCDDAGP